jgi:lipid II:glycine glycyltransferase (peptidoglycan interpeptide bridge formation enzyme)
MMTEQSWNDLVRKYAVPSGAFMHSWAWGEFQRSQGREVKRIVIGGDEAVTTLIAQAIKLAAPLGIRYWLVPKGPLGDVSPEVMRSTLVKELAGVDYIRTESVLRLPKTIGAKEMHPKTTRLIDISKGYEAVAGDFSTRVRYNTRLAKKKGVVCEFVGLDRFDEFVELMKQTAERDEFSLHEMKYYRAMLESLQGASECSARLAIASKDGTPLAATLTIDSFGTRTYLHGASGNQMRELKATHALQDFVIHDAIDSGMSSYDFWGIAPEGASSKHPWAGITEFKKAFGGYVSSSPGTFDIPLNSLKYGVYRVAKFVRGIMKR